MSLSSERPSVDEPLALSSEREEVLRRSVADWISKGRRKDASPDSKRELHSSATSLGR